MNDAIRVERAQIVIDAGTDGQIKISSNVDPWTMTEILAKVLNKAVETESQRRRDSGKLVQPVTPRIVTAKS